MCISPNNMNIYKVEIKSLTIDNITNVSDLILSSFCGDTDLNMIYTGSIEPEIAKNNLDELIKSRVGYFSYKNIITYQCNGENVGILISYPHFKSKSFEKRHLEYLSKNGINLDNLGTECFYGEYYLDTLRIDTRFRGKGITKTLFSVATKRAKKYGLNKLSLLVSSENVFAYDIYVKYGFYTDRNIIINNSKYYHMVKEI